MTSYFNHAAQAAWDAHASVYSPLSENQKRGANLMLDITHILEQNIANENFGLAQLCHEMGISRSQLFRKLKAKGVRAPSDLIRSFRLKCAKNLLEQTDLQVAEIAWQVGFKDAAHFTRAFKKEFGLLPKSVRR